MYGTKMAGTYDDTFVQPTERATPRLSLNANDGLRTIMMRQQRFISCMKRAPLGWDAHSWGAVGGQRVFGNSLFNFAVSLKLL